MPETMTNQPDRDTVLFFVGQFRQSDDAVKKARDDRKKVRSRAKVAGIEIEQLDRAIAEMELDDGTTVEGLKTFQRYCEWLGLPVGYQLKLFDDPADGKAFSQEGLNSKARRQGYERGLQGLNADDQAYPPMTPEGQEHMHGWNEGQKVLQDKLIRLSEEVKAEEAAPKKRGRKATKEAEKKAEPDARSEEELDEMAA